MTKAKFTRSKLKNVIQKVLTEKLNEQHNPLNPDAVTVGMVVQNKDTGENFTVSRVLDQAVLLMSEEPVTDVPDKMKAALGPGYQAQKKVVAVRPEELQVDYVLFNYPKKVNEGETKDQHNYEEFFRTKLKSMYDTEDLGDLSDSERKKFFSAVDHDWKSEKEKMDEQAMPPLDGDYGYDEMSDLEFSDEELDMLNPDSDMPPLYDDEEVLMSELDDDNISISDIRLLHRDRSKGDVDARERIRTFEAEFIELMDKLISALSPSEIDNVMRQIKRIPMVKRACEEEQEMTEGKRIKVSISQLDKIIEKYI